jgi:putative hydrolase of HD superfamily
VDKGKLVKMALLHDLAEVKTGDIVARRGATVLHDKKDKYEKEKKAFESLFLKVDCGREALKLWMEFEEQKTREAQLLKQIDKLEMTFQAFDYGGDVDSSKLDEFWNDTRTALKEPFLIKIFNELEKRRKK